MTPPVDFNWQEGDGKLSQEIEELRPSPPLPAGSQSQPARPEYHDHGLLTLTNLVLLGVGVGLGMVLGFVILTVQGQWKARADLSPIVELQYKAISQGDYDLYANLIDPEDQAWRELLAGAFPISTLLYDLDAEPPSVRKVELLGEYAEVEIAFEYGDEVYRRSEMMRLSDGRWHLVRAHGGNWGELLSTETDHVTLQYRERDDYLADYAPKIEAIVAAFCQRYQPPGGCKLDLTIEPDPNLMPFIPGQGALPLPPYIGYQGQEQGDLSLVTLNGAGTELADPAFRRRLLADVPDADAFTTLQTTESASSQALAISAQRLAGERIPLGIVSPRLVGLNDERPHPLWWLALYESIGDVIMRRALGPVTGPEQSVATLWAIARGDVARTAEAWSGVFLEAPDVGADEIDPAAIGMLALAQEPEGREAARLLATFMYERYGESQVLDMLRRPGFVVEDAPIWRSLATDPGQLAADFAAWLEQR